ncbi:SpoIIE family protein phosphatase [Actinospica robiniae]|uniref:SpoIIE family protein phosphatase n=1 Tax=Actinospica robiniae TaxID=304901 RepID=UPI0006884718|nr:SpoIIE family protein phosphatase [Actinospica robiniae]
MALHYPGRERPHAGAVQNSCGGSPLALVADDGTVTAWTRAATQMLGPSAEDAVGRRAEFFLGPDDGRALSETAGQVPGRDGWSANVRTPPGDQVPLRVTRLWRAADDVSWLLWAPADPDVTPPRAATRWSPVGRPAPGAAVWDRSLRCVMADDVMEQAEGIPRGRLLGHRMAQILPGIDSDALEAVMRNVLRTGSTTLDYRWELPCEATRARARTHLVSLSRLEGADGVGLGVCSLTVDVTSELYQHECLAVLGEASLRIGTSNDVMHTSQELADFSVPRIADYVTVDLAGREPLALLDPDAGRIPVFHRAGVASKRPGLREALFARGQPVYVPPSSPFIEVLTTGRSHLQPILDASRDAWFRNDEDRARVVRATGMHTLMVLPVREGDAILGVAVFVRNENPRPFDEDDLRLAEDLVGQTAPRLNRQRANAHYRDMAQALQKDLLPRHIEGGPGLEVTSRFVPADAEEGVGGDWFDVMALSDSRTGLIVGDVVGHGIGAAAAMGRLRTAVRTLAFMDLPPGKLLSRLDQVSGSFGEADAMDAAATSSITGATCLYLVHDPATRRVTAASAGHLPPAVVSRDGSVVFAESPSGTPLGYGLSQYEQMEFDVSEGDVIALYTDGLVETRGADIDVGMDRLAAALAHPGLSLPELCEAVFEARPSGQLSELQAELQLREPADDATLLLARVAGLE